MRSELIFQTPYWFIIICLLAGGAYAFLLYQPEASWSKKLNYALAALRGIVVAFICFLLLNPLIRRTESSVDKAKIVFAIDNSESLNGVGQPVLKQIEAAEKELNDAGYEVSVQTFDKASTGLGTDSIQFNKNKTDLSGLLQTVKSNFEGRNLTDVILLSDGISNQGLSPAFNQFPFKINTIA
ncbi:MAG: VWA domain-containing protein, partial [Dyadobacter sp.]